MENLMYISMIGALQYATYTQPEISYVINILTQYLQHPTLIHWLAVKRVLIYLQKTI